MPDENLLYQNSETIEGSISHIIYTNEENGYSVLEVELSDGGTLTAVGTIPYPGVGETVTAEGVYITHPSYGSQFKCISIDRILPAEANAIMQYLSCGTVKGVGPALARRIVMRFGIETFDVLEHDPERLCEVKGITQKQANMISSEFATKLAVRELMSFFSEYGLDVPLAMSVYKRYGRESRRRVTEDPYFLTYEPYYADFVKVDQMAQSLGFGSQDYVRLSAAVIFELYSNANAGHVCLPRDRLCDVTSQFLDLPSEDISAAMELMMSDGKLAAEVFGEQCFCYLPELMKAERSTAERLLALSKLDFSCPFDAEEKLALLEQSFGIEFSSKQRTAVIMSVSEPCMALTGGPGTGKTTAVRGMLGLLDIAGANTVLAAPTGRAAKRLSELTGRDAKTIHRLLEPTYTSEGLAFSRNADNPLDADVVIVDELSMVDIQLMAALLAALKAACRLIMVGDPDQLPSVGPGTVLRDILSSGAVKSVHLDEIFRQAKESDIIMNAHAVNRGELPRLSHNKKDFFFINAPTDDAVIKTVCDLCSFRLPDNMHIPSSEIQVITPTRIQATGTVSLNPVLRDLLNPPAEGKRERSFGDTLFREGDRVMQVRNNYDIPWNRREGDQDSPGMGVFNGDIGVIKKIDAQAERVTVEFVDKECNYEFDNMGELEHAYAVTVHKSQGSEFRAVVFVAALRNSRLLYRNLFYTAITRAKELLVIVGSPETVSEMVSNKRKMKRYGNLCARLAAGSSHI